MFYLRQAHIWPQWLRPITSRAMIPANLSDSMMPPPLPQLVDLFFQADLYEGYGFLDNRGGLLRLFGAAFERYADVTESGLNTIHLFGPLGETNPLVELKLTAVAIWLHFRHDVNMLTVRDESTRIMLEACKLMGVRQLARQGLRGQYIFPSTDGAAAVSMLRNRLVPPTLGWDELGELQSAGATVRVRTAALTANIIVQPVQLAVREPVARVGGTTAPAAKLDADAPRFGALLDADIFDDRLSESPNPQPHLNRAVDFVDSKLIPLVAKLLESEP